MGGSRHNTRRTYEHRRFPYRIDLDERHAEFRVRDLQIRLRPFRGNGGHPVSQQAIKPPSPRAVAFLLVRPDAFCHAYVNEEYAQLCRELTATLCRKRPSPLRHGKVTTWVCGIIHAVGMGNFLFDASQTPHIAASQIWEYLDLSASTMQAESKQIRDLLGMYPMDPEWSTPTMVDQNPLIWMVEVDGFVMDIRHAPRDPGSGVPARTHSLHTRRPMSRNLCENRGLPMPIVPLLLATPPTHRCAICQRPAPTKWSGGEELDEVVVYCCAAHQDQARQRWDEVHARFQATLDLDEEEP